MSSTITDTAPSAVAAIQCHNLWMWSDVPSKLPRYRCHLGCILVKMAAISLLAGWGPSAPSAAAAASKRAGACVLPTGEQPPLQLSLDLLLTENASDAFSICCAVRLANPESITCNSMGSRWQCTPGTARSSMGRPSTALSETAWRSSRS